MILGLRWIRDALGLCCRIRHEKQLPLSCRSSPCTQPEQPGTVIALNTGRRPGSLAETGLLSRDMCLAVLEEVIQDEIIDETATFESNDQNVPVVRRPGRDRPDVSSYLALFEHKIRDQNRLSPSEVQAVSAFLLTAIPEFAIFASVETVLKVCGLHPCLVSSGPLAHMWMGNRHCQGRICPGLYDALQASSLPASLADSGGRLMSCLGVASSGAGEAGGDH